MIEGPSPKKIKVAEKEHGNVSKRRKVEEVERSLPKEERNEVLKNQKVLKERIFDSRIFEKTRIVVLVEYVMHQGWLHLLEEPVPSIF